MGADVLSRYTLVDRQKLHVHRGTTLAATGSFTWTTYNPLLTIVPDPNFALFDLVVVLDLDLVTTGFATTYSSITGLWCIARKVDGTNYRTSFNLENGSSVAALSGTNASKRAVELLAQHVAPTDGVAVYHKVSATPVSTTFPYVVYYRSGAQATVTPAV